MLTLLPETRDNIIALKFGGMVTEADIDQHFTEVDAISHSHPIVRIIVDWRDLEGWVTGAKSLGTWFALHHRANVDRIAIVADPKWNDEKKRISDIFKAAIVRRFDAKHWNSALDWLNTS